MRHATPTSGTPKLNCAEPCVLVQNTETAQRTPLTQTVKFGEHSWSTATSVSTCILWYLFVFYLPPANSHQTIPRTKPPELNPRVTDSILFWFLFFCMQKGPDHKALSKDAGDLCLLIFLDFDSWFVFWFSPIFVGFDLVVLLAKSRWQGPFYRIGWFLSFFFSISMFLTCEKPLTIRPLLKTRVNGTEFFKVVYVSSPPVVSTSILPCLKFKSSA